MNALQTTMEGLQRLRDAAVAHLDLLRATDALHPTLYLDAACGNLQLAIWGLACQLAQEADAFPSDPAGSPERLRTLDGLALPFACARDPSDPRLSRLVAVGGAEVGREPLRASHPPDLGWALVGSDGAREHLAADAAAAVAQRALCERPWVHSGSLATWRCTPAGAATIVRLMRGGRPAPLLAPSPPAHLVDADFAGLVAGLGWRPGPVADWLAD